jgi:cytoskeletal protein CcmA (bactofilin family)
VQTERLAIEEGALLKGKVEAGKQPTKATESKAAAAAASNSPEVTSLSSGTGAA